MSVDKEWLIEECRKRCITSSYKLKYFVALKEAVPKEEWKDFLNQLWDEVDWSKEHPKNYYLKNYLGSVL